jgi:hypothetical protein
MQELECCPICRAGPSGVSFVYDFNRRCRRARHALTLSERGRQEKYERLAEKYGPEHAEQLRRDVEAISHLREGDEAAWGARDRTA